MQRGLAAVKQQVGAIDAVLHAAGVDGGQPLTTKALPDFEAILAAKIQGTLVLDEVLRDEPLKLVAYFSSSSATLGDFGACDYAIGNRFELTYAHYRNRLTGEGRRRGRALAIQWPLWRDGGMGKEDRTQTELYLRSSGQAFLDTDEGLALFDQLLASREPACLALKGQPERVHRFLGLAETSGAAKGEGGAGPLASASATVTAQRGRRAEMRGFSVAECLLLDLKAQVGALLHIPV